MIYDIICPYLQLINDRLMTAAAPAQSAGGAVECRDVR